MTGQVSGKRGRTGRVSRRELIKVGAAGGLASVVGAVAGAGAPTAKAASVAPFGLDEATIADLQAGMKAGEYTAGSLAAAYLERIEAIDRRGPTLRAVIETNPDALAIARALDDERRDKGPRGPLHGVPVLVKDNIATADRMETTAGSLALVGGRAPRDAFLVERLRAAGAVILGKTNLSEWANFRSSQSSSGWSARGGQCKNPYALDRSPCGSSSGTGAAIAASLAAAGVGTETDGSIVCPSHMCGLVGIKPTVGLVSRSGIVPIAHSQDTAGPMARTVTDAALLLAALAGPDSMDEATANAQGHIEADYTRFLDKAGLKGARIGVARKRFWGYSPEADAVCEAALEAMRAQGAVMVDPADIPNAGELDEPELLVLLYEFKADLNAYLKTWAPAAPVRSLAELIAFDEQNRDREMPFFGQDLFEKAQAKGSLYEKEYVKALERCRKNAREKGLDEVLGKRGLDAIVAPTGSPAWPIDLINGDHFLGASSTPAAVSGYPSITLPVGQSFGLPIGLTFIGARWAEGTLIKLAYSLEQAIGARKPPRFVPTVDLEERRTTISRRVGALVREATA